MVKKYLIGGLTVVAFAALPIMALADTLFPVASTTSLLTQFYADNGTIIYNTFVVLLAALAALLGLGFAIRHVKKWITGRKA